LGNTFTVKCPKNNKANKTEPFVEQTGSVMCQSCAVGRIGEDMDPQPKKYAVEVSWGRNIRTSDATEIWEKFSAYKIIIVDILGRKVGEPKFSFPVPVKNISGSSCCRPDEYSATVSGEEWPENAKRFMIVPYHVWFSDNDASSGKKHRFTMPAGSMTADFVDISEGLATEVKIHPLFKLPLDAAKAFHKSPHKFEIARDIVWKGLKDKGILKNQVFIKKVEPLIQRSRRLEKLDENSRRLQGKTEYAIRIRAVILLHYSYTGPPITRTSLDKDKMKEAFVKGASAVNLNVTASMVARPSLFVSSKEVRGEQQVEELEDDLAQWTARPHCILMFALVVAIAYILG